MTTEQEKAVIELKVFREFIQKAGLSVPPESIEKRGGVSEPDIFCTAENGEDVAFELVEICDQSIAATMGRLYKDAQESIVISTEDPTKNVLAKKLQKTYRTSRPIELLCYTNGRTISSDDMIIAAVREIAVSPSGRFRKIWLLGELNAYIVWPTR